jgi:hypothetical protein
MWHNGGGEGYGAALVNLVVLIGVGAWMVVKLLRKSK